MEYQGAIETAKGAARTVDLPAWVYRERGGFQVACMEWRSLTARTEASIVAVVLPGGEVLEQERVRTSVNV